MTNFTITSSALMARLRARFATPVRWCDPRGIASVEYAVIAGIIAIAISAGFTTLSGKLLNVLNALSF